MTNVREAFFFNEAVFAVDTGGTLYSWGQADDGIMGQGASSTDIDENTLVISPQDGKWIIIDLYYENGITTGATETTFNPGGTCTSAYVITFLWRANGEPIASGESVIAKEYAGQYFTSAVAWAEGSGLLDGTGSAFVSGNDSPRAEIVTYLYRNLASEAKPRG